MALRAKRLTLPDLANRAAKLESSETFVALRVSFVFSVLKTRRQRHPSPILASESIQPAPTKPWPRTMMSRACMHVARLSGAAICVSTVRSHRDMSGRQVGLGALHYS